ncbi:MAG: AAA family ATPase [Magnetococcales bacterium]|nr:AAA family ATPase [Magnetococcales bacterium]
MAEFIRITRLTLNNFKSIDKQEYVFGPFDLLVGRNNSGKSTILQAMAIWQYCVDLFHQSKGNKGIQVVLPNFTALPVPEFNLLWKDRTERTTSMRSDGKRELKYILIQIGLEWRDATGQGESFGVDLRYHSPQTIYAIPAQGWVHFRAVWDRGMPRIAYIPPFSGLEPVEKRLDISPIRQQVGKGQPGSVLRNLLLSVFFPPERSGEIDVPVKRREQPGEWIELAKKIKQWFGVEIQPPQYDVANDVHIRVEYKQNNKVYDVIAGGSGFHQALTLLAFMYGYRPTTLLIDEPDAHLHANLQREVIDYFQKVSTERGMQFLIATHAEEFVRGVATGRILSLLAATPRRLAASQEGAVVRALAELTNDEIVRMRDARCILYVEGESDERILRAWENHCSGGEEILRHCCFKFMHGGSKREMKDSADAHFKCLKQILPAVKQFVLFDLDNAEKGYHPDLNSPVHFEWKRRNIENYLLVPDAWKRVVQEQMGPLFAHLLVSLIDDFFKQENLTLPEGQNWKEIKASVFRVVDGKSILFENDDSLFHQLRQEDPSLALERETIAQTMWAEEIHEDVWRFFGQLAERIRG